MTIQQIEAKSNMIAFQIQNEARAIKNTWAYARNQETLRQAKIQQAAQKEATRQSFPVQTSQPKQNKIATLLAREGYTKQSPRKLSNEEIEDMGGGAYLAGKFERW